MCDVEERAALMFKLLALQQLHNLSDDKDQIPDTEPLQFHAFLGLATGIPDTGCQQQVSGVC
ncbi:hypothetical protein [Methyloglobulus sp.]|uniref:hypothetical protein n=1 Tax=Methyloglobulus sp. TaxID=2518622 RepID=UPI00398A1BB5